MVAQKKGSILEMKMECLELLPVFLSIRSLVLRLYRKMVFLVFSRISHTMDLPLSRKPPSKGMEKCLHLVLLSSEVQELRLKLPALFMMRMKYRILLNWATANPVFPVPVLKALSSERTSSPLKTDRTSFRSPVELQKCLLIPVGLPVLLKGMILQGHLILQVQLYLVMNPEPFMRALLPVEWRCRPLALLLSPKAEFMCLRAKHPSLVQPSFPALNLHRCTIPVKPAAWKCLLSLALFTPKVALLCLKEKHPSLVQPSFPVLNLGRSMMPVK